MKLPHVCVFRRIEFAASKHKRDENIMKMGEADGGGGGGKSTPQKRNKERVRINC